MSKSPCIGCHRENLSKDVDECKFCEARAAYVAGVEYHKFIDRPKRGPVIRYAGDTDMSKQETSGHTDPVDAGTETDTDTRTKVCNHCGQTKPLETGFHKHKTLKDGRENICKACKQQKARDLRKWRREQKERREKQAAESGTAKSAGCSATGNDTPRCRCVNIALDDAAKPEKGGKIPVNPVPDKAVETVKEPVKPAETVFKPRFKMPPRPGIDVPDDPDVLVLDFSKHRDLLERLKIVAKEEFRTPELQAMYVLSMDMKDPAFFGEDITPWAKEEPEQQEA